MAVKMLCFILYFNTECLSASESQSRKGYLKGYLLPFSALHMKIAGPECLMLSKPPQTWRCLRHQFQATELSGQVSQ